MNEDEVRDALAEVMTGQHVRPNSAGHLTRRGAEWLAEPLIPTVRRIVATELRTAANEAWEDSFEIARMLRRRADTIHQETP